MSTGGFWPGDRPAPQEAGEADEAVGTAEAVAAEPGPEVSANGDRPAAEAQPAAEVRPAAEVAPAPEPSPGAEDDTGDQPAVVLPEPEQPALHVAAHAPGELRVPDVVVVLEGVPSGPGRAVGIVVSRFNGEVTSLLLESALAELDRAGIPREHVTVVPVPGAFELPLAAMGLAKTRRYACIVALGCVIRGETPHFEYVAGEAASGLQLAALETGVPVAFGVLTVDTLEQAAARVEKGADAAASALEMADLFSQLRQQRM